MRDYIIHLIRHGETLANTEKKYIGKTDLPITEEAKKELEALREDGIYPAVGAVYSSPLKRCLQTARIIYPGKPLTAVEDLSEYDFGAFEGKTDSDLESSEEYRAWRAGKLDTPPEGESMSHFKERIYAGLVSVVHDMSANDCFDAAIVTHGGVIMTLLSLCGLPQKNSLEWLSENGKGFTVRVNTGMFSRSGHVEVCGTVPEQ